MKKIIATLLLMITICFMASCGKSLPKYTIHFTDTYQLMDTPVYDCSDEYDASDMSAFKEMFKDENASQKITMEILGKTYDLTYVTSRKRFGELKYHRYRNESDDVEVYIDPNTGCILEFKIPYTLTLSTEEEFLEWIQEELIPDEDMTKFARKSVNMYTHLFKDAETDLDRYSVSYSDGVLRYAKMNPDWGNDVYKDLIANLRQIKAKLNADYLKGSIKQYIKDKYKFVAVSECAFRELFVKDGKPHVLVVFTVSYGESPDDNIHSSPESIFVRYEQ